MKTIILSKHAQEKLSERFSKEIKVNMDLIRQVILEPDFTERDKNYAEVVHSVKKVGNRYLRVIFKEEGNGVNP